MASASSIIVPGDKSITHRALLLAGLARGRSRIEGALTSLDARSTARVLRALGVAVSPLQVGTTVTVSGRRRWEKPSGSLHCGNSGTTARLLIGILSAQPIAARITGDRSLRARPMRRVTEPLSRMGAEFDPPLPDRLPLTISGGRVSPIRWELPVSSAQLKSAILLAGLVGRVPVAVREPDGLSRDHTERMLRGMRQQLVTRDGWIELEPGPPLEAFDLRVPADPSSAAFLIGAASLGVGRELLVSGIGLNPTRTGFLQVLERMGGRFEARVEGEALGEPIGSIRVERAELSATRVWAAEIPGLIDEVPLLAVLAARADGVTRFDEVGELRVKESDRLGLIARNLETLGYRAQVDGNSLVVEGSDHPPRGRVVTAGDHRIAMAFGVLGAVPGARVEIDDRACVAVSFPGFFDRLRELGRTR
jgi:3-phosphoshikimate 1-carboxyvinyltransferase